MRVFMGIYHTINLNYSGTTATANYATRTTGGSVNDGGTGQLVLRCCQSNADVAGIENIADATGALASAMDCSRTIRSHSEDSWDAGALGANSTCFLGVRATLGNAVPTANEVHAGFVWNGTVFKASSSNGAGVGQTTNLTTPTTGAQHSLEAIVFGSQFVEFYVDGVLVATHATAAGLPAGAVSWQRLLTTDGGGGAGTFADLTLRTGFTMECPA
jgi:hypothetical protein